MSPPWEAKRNHLLLVAQNSRAHFHAVILRFHEYKSLRGPEAEGVALGEPELAWADDKQAPPQCLVARFSGGHFPHHFVLAE